MKHGPLRILALPMIVGMATASGASPRASATMLAADATMEAAMQADTGNITRVTGADSRLEVSFEIAASGALKVTYRLHNDGQRPLMVFDRGNRHAVMTRQLVQGEVAAPLFAEDDGDVTLSHRALPLPDPVPIIPPTPLAARVEPGAELSGAFEFSIPTQQAPKRVRWCLGVIPFADDFKALKPEPQAKEVWLGSLKHGERQQLLCTPWFDTAKAAFDA